MRWRYLDSLDSTRYSQTEFIHQSAPRQLRVEQASVEMIATMLMGNGIRVPNNQLIDSIGFLRIASSMLKVASRLKSKQDIYIPITYANYDYSHEKTGGSHLRDPFLLAAYLFDKDGKEDHKYFELSALSGLGSRRGEWANIFREKGAKIPPALIKSKLEDKLASDLFRVLDFFSLNKHLIVEAASTKGIREFMTASIANLTREYIENDEFFVSLLTSDPDSYDDRLTRLLDIVNVFKRLMANGILDNRSLIREHLVEYEQIYFDDTRGSIEKTRVGVLKSFNSIYNFSSYKSTRARQDNQTEPLYNDDIWGPDEAAFALGRWVRENYEVTHRGKNAARDVVSLQDFSVAPSVNEEPIEEDKERLKKMWEVFFEHQHSKEWETSLTKYMNSLSLFEKVKHEYDAIEEAEKTKEKFDDLVDAAKEYEECRIQHIDNVNTWLPTGYEIVADDQEKLRLICYDNEGEIISKVLIENFGEHATLTKIQKGANYASEIGDRDTSAKGCTAEYGD